MKRHLENEMPKKTGKDKKGNWMRWGSRGKKIHYKPGNKASRQRAQAKLNKDRRRIEFYKHKK